MEKPYDYSRSRPLEQEKSKLSLAEVYEQEYIKQTQVMLKQMPKFNVTIINKSFYFAGV